MKNTEIIEFAYNSDGKVVHISKVQNGLDCNCFCIRCNGRLVAKKGDVRIHHFSHHDKSILCEYGRESELHYLAKQIISKEKRLWLPPSEIWIPSSDNWLPYLEEIVRKKIKIDRGGSVKITSVELETRIQDIIPDLIVTIGSEEIIVEIFVTHPIDEQKKYKIKQMGMSCIEIDLSSYKDKTIDYETLERLLLNENKFTVWKVDDWARKVQPRLEDFKEELFVDDQEFVFSHYCVNDGLFDAKRKFFCCLNCNHCFMTKANSFGKINRIYCLSKLGAFDYNNLSNIMGLNR